MERNYKISVAMASYNGEKYIKDQVDSILKQLNVNDELVISDDGSTDRTVDIISSYKDRRIKILKGPKKGVKQNFANAINHCSGKYIFLSDQDDVWMDNKVEKVLDVFQSDSEIMNVVHDCLVIDSNLNIIEDSFFKLRNSKRGILKNIWKNSYIGCCMAFNSSIKDKILPIPNDIEMHDQWIGIKAELNGKSVFIKEKLIKYRRHDANVSNLNEHYSINKMLKNRFVLIFEVMKRGR